VKKINGKKTKRVSKSEMGDSEKLCHGGEAHKIMTKRGEERGKFSLLLVDWSPDEQNERGNHQHGHGWLKQDLILLGGGKSKKTVSETEESLRTRIKMERRGLQILRGTHRATRQGMRLVQAAKSVDFDKMLQ